MRRFYRDTPINQTMNEAFVLPRPYTTSVQHGFMAHVKGKARKVIQRLQNDRGGKAVESRRGRES